MRNMLRFLKGYEKESILAPLFKMLEACFELLVPLVVANIIDVGIKNGDLAYIGKQCGLMVLLAVVGMASSLTAQYFAAKAALGYGTALRGALFRHIDTLSYTELDGIGTPTLVTRITSDVNQLQNGVNMTLRLLLRCPFIVIADSGVCHQPHHGVLVRAGHAGHLAGGLADHAGDGAPVPRRPEYAGQSDPADPRKLCGCPRGARLCTAG